MTHPEHPDSRRRAFLGGAMAIGAFALAGCQKAAGAPGGSTAPAGLVANIDKFGKIRAGYGGFPPYTIEDPASGKVSGICIDIVNEIARQLGVPVEWKKFNWNTMKADLDRGEFDLLADAVFQTPARARELTFTDAYVYLPIGIGVVARDNNRFSQFDQINDPAIRVAVGQGFAEETFVRARAPKAQVISIQSAADTAAPINAVVAGRADIAIVNNEDAKRFLKANGRDLKALWLDAPPAYAPASFVVRFGDLTGADFLNASLENLRSTGVIRTVAQRYGVTPVERDPLAV